MEKRHMDAIIERCEEFSVTGVTRFKRWELRSWFGAERLGKNVWRNLVENLEEKAPGTDVRVFEVDNEFIVVNAAMVQKLQDWT
jgi:hypothetical protein